jgi:hypothetical protein
VTKKTDASPAAVPVFQLLAAKQYRPARVKSGNNIAIRDTVAIKKSKFNKP